MENKKRVGFFVTCLVDSMRPSIAFASIKLLEENNCDVIVPKQQTCCGQPAFNSGDEETTKIIARKLIDTFSEYDYLVAPSGSCLGTIKTHYPDLFKDEPDYHKKAILLSEKSYEILTFLHEVLHVKLDVSLHTTATYHDSCSGLRELSIKQQPRELLSQVNGLTLHEMEDTEICCGFGGTFCVKYPDISNSLVSEKVDRIKETEAEVLLAGDLGCLLNIAGRCERLDVPVRCFHAVEILAGMGQSAAIGESKKD